MSATLSFFGGAGTVTGSKHLLSIGGRRVLLDCGLFQGLKALRLRNWARPPFDPAGVDAVVLSHAHVDHSAYLPLLARAGFRGLVHCTPATADLLPVVLMDAARLQEEDARRANEHGYSRHRPAEPLFRVADVERALALVRPHPYGAAFPIGPADGNGDLRVVLRRAGHILGSATVEVIAGRSSPLRLVFSGDLGRWGRPILRDPELVPEADVVVIESTYGDRLHRPDADDELARLVEDTASRGGTVLVPAFAIGRTQELLWRLGQLVRSGRLPALPIVVDSPMALDVTDVYLRHTEEHDLDMRQLAADGDNPLRAPNLRLVRTPDESKALNALTAPAILIAGSGMATGGRVLHHLARLLPDPRHTVLLPGFQAAGTRGRALQDGAETLRIHGRDVLVRARVHALAHLSAHADRDDLLRWLRGFRHPPRATWVVHGEPAASAAFAQAITRELGWDARVAVDGATVDLA